MKTLKTAPKKLVCMCAAIAMAMAAWMPVPAAAADQPMKPMKGAEHLMMLSHIDTPAQAEQLKPGDEVAMVCAKCKSVIVQKVTTEKGHIKTMTVGEKHLCPGCNTYIKVVGVGHGAKDEVKHVCEKCGSDSAFCCATKPDGSPTKGMEQEKK